MHIDISQGSIRNSIEDAGDRADAICDRIASELVIAAAGAVEKGRALAKPKSRGHSRHCQEFFMLCEIVNYMTKI